MLSSHTEETLYGMRAIQSFCQESERATLFDGAINNALDAIKQRIRIRALLSATVIALVFTAIGVVLWIGGKDLLLGKITPGELSSFLFYALVVAGATGAISDVIGDMQRAAGATERIMDFLAISPNISSPKNPRALPSPVKGSVVFDHVTFFYPTRPDTAALNDISFCVNPGERVAIVGASGAGKSTLFELLLRFYEPQYGTITLDDVRIDECDISELRSQMGLVPQSPVIFSASIHDNIALANSHATDAEIQRAAQQAHAIEFIDRLPETFQTMVGEKGVMLSGGQKQRLAIARVFLQRAPLLLLDEATSALDANSEAAVQEAFDELMQSHTTLVIAHRLSTVLKADRILVMEHGRIIEQGTHAELLKKKGHYAKLAKMQFLNQQDPAADAKNTDVGHAV
jgi:ATP-binding cassette subfamily B protein